MRERARRRRPWGRWMVIALALLLAGAVVNVGVAWGAALFSPLTLHLNFGGFDQRHPPTGLWRTLMLKLKPPAWEFVVPYHTEGFGLRISGVRASVGSGDYFCCDRHDAGWPMPSLRSEFEWSRSSAGPIASQTFEDAGWASGLPIPRDWGAWRYARRLPVRPLWAGFAVNTVLFAAILALPLAAMALTRRVRRVRAGRCPRCGYDVSGLIACPECGGELGDGKRSGPSRTTTT